MAFAVKAQHPFRSIESLNVMMVVDKAAYADSLRAKHFMPDTTGGKIDATKISYYYNDNAKGINDHIIRVDDPTAAGIDPSITLLTTDKAYFKLLVNALVLQNAELLKKKRHLRVFKSSGYFITFRQKGSNYYINISRHSGNMP